MREGLDGEGLGGLEEDGDAREWVGVGQGGWNSLDLEGNRWIFVEMDGDECRCVGKVRNVGGWVELGDNGLR